MTRVLKVLAVDQFLHNAEYGSWLEWIVQKDNDGRPFVVTDEGQRVDEGDFVVTQISGERRAFKHIDFIRAFDAKKDNGVVALIEVP